MEESPDKTHVTAVVWIPPESAWEPIQKIRRKYDKKIDRWMPHLNLLYPFRPREALEEAVRTLSEASAAVPPFEVDLTEVRQFSHGRERYTLWLAPEPAEPLVSLQAALQDRFPDCDDVASFESGFIPHLSVGQALDRRTLDFRLRDIRAGWSPLRLPVSEIAVIAREENTPFRIERTIRLGP